MIVIHSPREYICTNPGAMVAPKKQRACEARNLTPTMGRKDRAFLMSTDHTFPRKPIVLIIDPAVMAERGRLGGLALHARVNSADHLAPARQAMREKFYKLADPQNQLDPQEREKRAAAMRRAHFQRISAMGVAARRARRTIGAEEPREVSAA